MLCWVVKIVLGNLAVSIFKEEKEKEFNTLIFRSYDCASWQIPCE